VRHLQLAPGRLADRGVALARAAETTPAKRRSGQQVLDWGRNSTATEPQPLSDVTHILSQIESGDPSAAEQLLPLVYDELRKLAAAKLAHGAI